MTGPDEGTDGGDRPRGPSFEKPSGGQDPAGQPGYGQQPFGAPGPGYGQQPPGYGSGYGQPSSGPGTPYGQPYGQPYGTPAYGGGGVVGPGGEWLGPPLASWGRRVGGALIDGLISAVVGGVLTAVSPDLGRVAQLIVLLVFGYLTGTTGQTPGRTAVGIKVLRLRDGQVLGPGAGIGRAFLHVLDALPLLLGYLWPIWDAKKQTFADKIIGSVVIKV